MKRVLFFFKILGCDVAETIFAVLVRFGVVVVLESKFDIQKSWLRRAAGPELSGVCSQSPIETLKLLPSLSLFASNATTLGDQAWLGARCLQASS